MNEYDFIKVMKESGFTEKDVVDLLFIAKDIHLTWEKM
jgi:hypothetical protein